MREILRKIFGLHPKEGHFALRFAILSVLWAFGSSLLETLSDSLFLEHIGANLLPRAYLCIALGMLLVSTIVLYSLKRTSPYRIFFISLSLGALFCLAAALRLSHGPLPPLFWYALKIGSRMFFALLIASSWTFIDQYHDLQDAKRIYALYSASYFLGTIFAGLCINALLSSIGFNGLLLLSMASFLAAMAQSRHITRLSPALQDDTVEGIFSGSRDSFSTILHMIRRSRYTLLLLLLSLAIQLLLTITEFNYMEVFGKISSSQEEIASFLGTTRAAISAGNILISLFFYSRFVRKWGLHNVLLITPLFFVSVYGIWVLHTGLPIAILALIAVDGVLFTIEDNTFNLLSTAVPTKLKSKVRIINDSFFEPIGMLLSALLLFLIQMESQWIGLTLALLVLLVSIAVRSLYAKALFHNLKENALHFRKTMKEWMAHFSEKEAKDVTRGILQALHSPKESEKLLAIKALLDLENPSFLPQILFAAKPLGTLPKIRLLHLFKESPFHQHTLVIQALFEWLDTTFSPELTKWIHLYLAKRDLYHPEKPLSLPPNAAPEIKGAYLLTLRNDTDKKDLLHSMLSSTHIDEVSMALDILSLEKPEKALPKIFPFLRHASLLVQRSAAKALAHLATPSLGHFGPLFLEEFSSMKDTLSRVSLLEAIGKMKDPHMLRQIFLASIHFRPNERRNIESHIESMGIAIAPHLLSLLSDSSLPDRARLFLGKILAKIDPASLQQALPPLLEKDMEKTYLYFYTSHTIQSRYPQQNLHPLENALRTGYQSSLDTLLHFLAIYSPIEDPDLLVRSLQNPNPKIHSHAVESLEKHLESSLFRSILPLIEDFPLEEKLQASLRLYPHLRTLSLETLMKKLDESPSLLDKMVSTQLSLL